MMGRALYRLYWADGQISPTPVPMPVVLWLVREYHGRGRHGDVLRVKPVEGSEYQVVSTIYGDSNWWPMDDAPLEWLRLRVANELVPPTGLRLRSPVQS